ncbi:Pancreatic trypsin inhibitor Kunitz domain, partial [Trinorchestia longiramus]
MLPLFFTLTTLVHLGLSQSSIARVCFQEPETGSCRAYLPSFYFNVRTGSCDCFVYGGCAPGGNNFETMEMCMMTCGKNQATQVMSSDCRRILANVNVARPIESSQNQDTSSSGSRPP